MIVEATRTENGFMIPMTEYFKHIKKDKIFLKVTVVDREMPDDLYSPIDDMIGLCESGKTDSSVNHDTIIYGKKAK